MQGESTALSVVRAHEYGVLDCRVLVAGLMVNRFDNSIIFFTNTSCQSQAKMMVNLRGRSRPGMNCPSSMAITSKFQARLSACETALVISDAHCNLHSAAGSA